DLPQDESPEGSLPQAIRPRHAPCPLDQRSVLDTGRADGLASAAIEAGVHVLGEVGIVSGDLALVDRFDLVDPPAGRVHLDAEYAIGRTVVETEAAMDALLEERAVELHVDGG